MSVASPPPTTFLDEMADLLASEPTPDDLFNFRPSEYVIERLDALLEKNRESILTSEEKAELDEMLRLGRLLNAAVLRVRIRLVGAA
jgi:hypothetical protein